MNGVAAAVLVLGVAAGALVQASGFGGPVASGAAGAVVAITILYLVIRARRPSPVKSPVKGLRGYLARRDEIAPPARDVGACREHDEDTMEGFWRLHASAVKRFTRNLRDRGIIGRLEEARLNNPRTVPDLERLLVRLTECQALTR